MVKNVEFIQIIKVSNICKELNLRQRRKLELFKDYDCIIYYHPRKPNVVAYALSRKAMAILLIQHNEWRIVSDGAILDKLKT